MEKGNRANGSMRARTALTAIFLPLKLVSGFIGVNFEVLPLGHELRFRRKRHLSLP